MAVREPPTLRARRRDAWHVFIVLWILFTFCLAAVAAAGMLTKAQIEGAAGSEKWTAFAKGLLQGTLGGQLLVLPAAGVVTVIFRVLLRIVLGPARPDPADEPPEPRTRAQIFRRPFLWLWLMITVLSALPLGCIGFGFGYYRDPASVRDWINFAGFVGFGAVMAQLWALPVAALLAWIWCISVARLARRPAGGGFCLKCGYNLRGNVSGRCPECGWVIADPLSAPRFVQIDETRLWRAWTILVLAAAAVIIIAWYVLWR